jgi:DNA gyrase subunit A
VFELSEAQARAILDMRLQKLTGLERQSLLAEYEELLAKIQRLRAILASDRLVLEEIRGELTQLKETYAEARRTEILADSSDISIEDMIADEEMVITVSRTGYVKRSPLSIYRSQARGGKGRTGMLTKEEDLVQHLYIASAHSYVLVFTESGRVHWLKVHEIPHMGAAAKGKAIVNLLNLQSDERIATTAAVREFKEDEFLVFASEKGTVKRTALAAYGNPRAGGIIGIGVGPEDRLLEVRVTRGGGELLLATEQGYAIRFSEEDARPMGRTAHGVRGIHLRPGDRVVAMEALEVEGDVMSVASRGYGKRTTLGAYRLQSRGGKGIINLKVSDRTGPVVGVMQVGSGDELVIITREGKLIRIPVAGVRPIGRSTQGVKLMDLGAEDRIVAVARVVDRNEEAEEEAAEDADDEPIN